MLRLVKGKTIQETPSIKKQEFPQINHQGENNGKIKKTNKATNAKVHLIKPMITQPSNPPTRQIIVPRKNNNPNTAINKARINMGNQKTRPQTEQNKELDFDSIHNNLQNEGHNINNQEPNIKYHPIIRLKNNDANNRMLVKQKSLKIKKFIIARKSKENINEYPPLLINSNSTNKIIVPIALSKKQDCGAMLNNHNEYQNRKNSLHAQQDICTEERGEIFMKKLKKYHTNTNRLRPSTGLIRKDYSNIQGESNNISDIKYQINEHNYSGVSTEFTVNGNGNSYQLVTNRAMTSMDKKVKDSAYYQCQNKMFKDSMEDFGYIECNYYATEKHSYSFFGIYDGHNGKHVSEFLKSHFHKALLPYISDENMKMEECLSNAFILMDQEVEKIPNTSNCGSTATTVVINNNIIYIANVGDSSCYIVSSKCGARKMSRDHKCTDSEEAKRIKARGGLIFNNRWFGSLALSKAIGDTDYKQYGLCYIPSISKEIISEDLIFCVLASDGVWDVVDGKKWEELWDPKQSAKTNSKNIVKYAMDNGSKDNISCIVIKF